MTLLPRLCAINVLLLVLTVPSGWAGDLNPPAGPDDPLSAVYTLEDLYNRLDTGAQGAKRTGAFTGPPGPPGTSGRSLESVMGKMPEPDNTNGATPGEVSAGKTFWGLRTDGSWGLQTGAGLAGQPVCKGTLSPAGRWCDQGDGTVLDMSTNLVWLKKRLQAYDYAEALEKAYSLENGKAWSGLADGSQKGDWRLPMPNEYRQLINGSEHIGNTTKYFFESGIIADFYLTCLIRPGGSNDPRWFVNGDIMTTSVFMLDNGQVSIQPYGTNYYGFIMFVRPAD